MSDGAERRSEGSQPRSEGSQPRAGGPGRRSSRPGRSGRRPGSPDTRGAILEAARGLFAERGYERTTIRSVAAAAGVDPALVHHYFGSKVHLFAAVGAPPIDVAEILPMEPVEGELTGTELARRVLGVYERNPQARSTLQALVRAAASQDEAATALRDLFTGTIHAALRGVVKDDTAELRASLIASQVGGIFLGRYIVGFPGLDAADIDDVALAIGPAIQHYLTGDLAPSG